MPTQAWEDDVLQMLSDLCAISQPALVPLSANLEFGEKRWATTQPLKANEIRAPLLGEDIWYMASFPISNPSVAVLSLCPS